MDALFSIQGVFFLFAALGAAVILRPTSALKPVNVPSQSAVLVTGGNRGIGKSTAYHLIAKGYFVFVTVRSEKQFEELEQDSEAPCPVLLDVTNDEQVDPAVKRVQEICADKKISLVALVNNAGINPEGDMYQRELANKSESSDTLCDPGVATRVMETNVVGVIRITRAFLPLLAASKSARIINLGSYFGSIAGKVGLRQAAYEASKFALEGLSDNMRRALKKDGINVSLIKPGNIATDMNDYGEVGPEVVAKDIEHAIGSPNPRPRYYPGKVKGYSVRFLCWMFGTLPASITDNNM